jgi:hypothetical protein
VNRVTRPIMVLATKIALRSSVFAAAALALALIVGMPAAHAGPAMSYLSYTADFDQDACTQRAQASFDDDGWTSVVPSEHAVDADRGPLSGVIVCVYDSFTQSIPVIVVTGGDGNADAADAAADSLKNQMQ